jgi:hypothetical protein
MKWALAKGPMPPNTPRIFVTRLPPLSGMTGILPDQSARMKFAMALAREISARVPGASSHNDPRK